MKAVDRPQRWISLDHVLDCARIEIRIHRDSPCDDAPAMLTAQEARALAHALLLMANRLEGVN